MAEDLGFHGDPLDTAGMVDSVDKQRRAALRATLLWIDELYNYNQATRFKIKPSFPVSNGPGALMMTGVLWPGPSRPSEPEEIEKYSLRLRWPSMKVLRRISPDTLLGLRSDEYGCVYMDSLQDFRDNPNDNTWDALTLAMKAYAEKVCKAAKSDVHSTLDAKHFRSRNGIAAGIALSGVAVGLAVGTAGIAGVISLVAGGLAAAYPPVGDFVRDQKAGAEIKVPVRGRASGKRGNVRIDLPAK